MSPCNAGLVDSDGTCGPPAPVAPVEPVDPVVPDEPDCGFENGPCCGSPADNPNIGDCNLDSLACWEGTCMPCGLVGKPGCVSAPPPPPTPPP